MLQMGQPDGGTPPYIHNNSIREPNLTKEENEAGSIGMSPIDTADSCSEKLFSWPNTAANNQLFQ